jgi:hypothetical protein
MAYNRNQARALTNASEYELFTSSLADAITGLTPAQLRGKVTRTRNLRDKNTDLFRRQSLSVKEASGSKRGRTGAANQRTEQKAKLFDETLKRYENRLAKLTSSANSATGSAAAKGSAAKPSIAKPAASARTVARPTPAKRKASAKTAAKTALASAVKKGASKKAAAKSAPAAKGGAGKKTATASKGPVKSIGKGPARAAGKTAARGKVQAAHTRSSNARSQAKRDKT